MKTFLVSSMPVFLDLVLGILEDVSVVFLCMIRVVYLFQDPLFWDIIIQTCVTLVDHS